ncbi:MAG: DUF5658 family protein [Armatimonadota bacterium]
MRLKLCTESLILIGICVADMAATLFFVLKGLAVEQNPIMAACINHSAATFVFVKLVSFVPFIIAVELYRRRNPGFARAVCRWAIAVYLITFTALTLGANVS